jgi:hypothetical protein
MRLQLPVPSGGVLSEGDKRDSKGKMPKPGRKCQDCAAGLLSSAAEATLLRSQHLGLGRGGSGLPFSSPSLPRGGCRWVGPTLEEEDHGSLGLGWSRLSETVVGLVALFPKPFLDLQVWSGLVFRVKREGAGGELLLK